jgi:hypothetical protein
MPEVKVSIGDFVDRMSILLIKREKGLDVAAELDGYYEAAPEDGFFSYFLAILRSINEQLWDIESRKRSGSQRHSREYSELSTLTTQLNDLRHEAKKRIDEFYESDITERKDHSLEG